MYGLMYIVNSGWIVALLRYVVAPMDDEEPTEDEIANKQKGGVLIKAPEDPSLDTSNNGTSIAASESSRSGKGLLESTKAAEFNSVDVEVGEVQLGGLVASEEGAEQ